MKEITTNGIKILLVEVPENASGYILNSDNILFDIKHGLSKATVMLPSGQYQILGKSTESIHELLGISKESYLSLLEANGIVDRNPYGDNCPPDVEPENDDDLGVISAIRYQKIGQWMVAQSKVKDYIALKRI